MVMDSIRTAADELARFNGRVAKIKAASARALNSVKHKEKELKLLIDIQQKRVAIQEGVKQQHDLFETKMSNQREKNREQKQQVWASGQKAAEFTRARNKEMAKQAREKKTKYASESITAFNVHEHVKDLTKQERELRRQKRQDLADRVKSSRTAKVQDRDNLRQRWREAYTELHDEYDKSLAAKKEQIVEGKKTRCVPSNTLRADRQEQMKQQKNEEMKAQLRDRAAWMKRTVYASYADSLKEVKATQDVALEKKKKADEETAALDKKIQAAKAQLGMTKQAGRSKQFLR
jgi:hypothetical protein